MKTAQFVVLAVVLMSALIPGSALCQVKVVTVKTTADSEAGGYDAFKAMDGDPQTMWHTYFGSGETGHPHDLICDLQASYTIDGFSYLPRPGGGNGTIKDYEFYVSDDKKIFGKATATGTFEKPSGESTVKFAKPAKGRYIKLRALSEIGGKPWTSIAELRILTKGIAFTANESSGMIITTPTTEVEMQYETIRRDLQNRKHILGHADQTFNDSP